MRRVRSGENWQPSVSKPLSIAVIERPKAEQAETPPPRSRPFAFGFAMTEPCETCGAPGGGRCALEGPGDCPEGCVTPEQW